MATKTLLQTLNRESVRFLIIACERFYTQSLLGEPDQSVSLNIEIPELIKLFGKSRWSSKKEFFLDVTKITGLGGIGEDQIKQVSNALYAQESKIPLEKETVSRTVPLNIKELTEEYERTTDEKRKAELTRQIQQARRELQKRKILEQKQPELEKQKEEIKEALEGKILYAEPKEPLPKIQLAPQEKQALDKLTKSVQGNQKIFVAKLTRQIIENASPEIKKVISPDQLELAVNRVALDVSDRLLNKTPVAPAEVFASLADMTAKLETTIPLPIAVDQIRQAGASFAVLSKASDTTTRLLLYPVLGKNITSTIYGPSEVTYSITATPTENTAFTISPSILYNDFSTFEQSPVYEALINPVTDLAKDKLTSLGKDALVAQLKNLPKEGLLGFVSRFASSGAFESGISLLSGFQTEYAATNILGKFITTFLPEYTPIIGGMANFLKINLGLAPAVAGTIETTAVTIGVPTAEAIAAGTAKPATTIAGGAIKATLGKAVTAIGAKLGLSAAFAKIGAVISSIIPIPFIQLIGAAIGWLVGWLVGKLIDPIINWIRKHKEDLTIAGVLVLAGGILIGSAPLIIVGGLIAIPGLLGGIGLGGVGLGIGRFFAGLGGAFIVTIGTPVIITLIAFPVVVALILFIINSGAYLVPPKLSQIGAISPYIDIKKTPTPKNEYENSELPITVEYIVEIRAKKGPLTNLRFEDKCKVFKKGTAPACPSPDPPIPAASASATISPAGPPYVIKYARTYTKPVFEDSLVLDTFTVTADTPGEKDTKASMSASVIIGAPPTGCFKLVGNNWPSGFRSNLEGAIINLTISHPVFAAKVCSGGEIGIAYDPSPTNYWGYHNHAGEIDITLYSGGLTNQLDAEYILTHEASHHLQRIMPTLYLIYYANLSTAIERPICSYSATNDPSEAFPEMNALYGSEKPLGSFSGCSGISGTFKDRYPAHWNFANDIVFK